MRACCFVEFDYFSFSSRNEFLGCYDFTGVAPESRGCQLEALTKPYWSHHQIEWNLTCVFNCHHLWLLMIVSFCSSQILSGTSGPSAAPQKGKEGADSENLEVRNTKCHWKENSFEKKKTVWNDANPHMPHWQIVNCVSLQQDLCTFLISRACKNSTLANYLYWWVRFGATQRLKMSSFFLFLSVKPVCHLPQVCDCGVWGSGHPAERSKDPRDVPERDEEVQSGFTQGQERCTAQSLRRYWWSLANLLTNITGYIMKYAAIVSALHISLNSLAQ